MTTQTRNYKSAAAYKKAQARQRDALDAARRAEREDEEKGRVLAELMMDPLADVAELAAKAGMSEAMIRGLRTKAETQFQAPATALKRATNARLLELIEDRELTVIEALTPAKINGASLREQIYALDRLHNIRQLLRGEPTQIVSVDDRKTLNELVPALVKAAQRRGIVVDSVSRVIEEPQRGIPDSRVLPIEDAEIIHRGAEATVASEDVIDVRGGVTGDTSCSSGAPTPTAVSPNDPLSGRASALTPETTGSPDP
jgi:ribosomal protein S12